MPKATFLLSTGRTATQSLAATVAGSRPDAVVDHEGLGPDYFPRRVFRRPGRFAPVLGAQVPIQRKLIEIEDTLKAGRAYFELGWPCYAWLPYLQTRLGERFRFMHLVRNPFHVAASLTTHALFVPNETRGRRFQNRAMIHVGDPALRYPHLLQGDRAPGPFERNLFHWLELNAFALEMQKLDGFAGMARFEDLFRPEEPGITDFLERFCGVSVSPGQTRRVDREQKVLDVGIGDIDPALFDAVVALSLELGYEEQDILASFDPHAIARRYSSARM